MVVKTGKKERVIILLDGSNFYHRLKEIGLERFLKFDYRKLAQYLAHGRVIQECVYYVGLVRKEKGNKKSEELVRYQQKLFAHLQSPQQNWVVKTGYMMKHDKDYKEKGVDVKIAVDILIKAYRNEYDTAIVVSSDTDLLPAITSVRELGKKVEYIGFSHNPSFGIQKEATESRLLTKFEISQFLKSR